VSQSVNKHARHRGEDLKKLIIQKNEFPVAAMFVNGLKLNEQSL
jgi:hypothetical protein